MKPSLCNLCVVRASW